MKLLYLSCDPGVPLFGRKGCSTHIRETCISFIEEGIDTLIAVALTGEDIFNSPKLNYIKLPTLKSKMLGFDLRLILNNIVQWRSLKSSLKEFKPDAIYERHSLYATIGRKLEKNLKIPRVLEINAILSEDYKDRLKFNSFAKYAEIKSLKNAQAIIALSEPMKKKLLEFGVSEDKITIIPMAVNPNFFNPAVSGGKIKKKLNLEGKTIFGYVGGFNYYHNINNLIKLAEHFKNKNYDAVVLVIGGDENKVKKYKNTAKTKNLENYIIFTGSIPYQFLPEYIAAMDVTIISGQKYYSPPTKIYEYAAMEKPIIAPDLIPIRSVIDKGETSKFFLFNPDNSDDFIEKADYLFTNPEIRNSLTKKIRESVINENTWQANTKKVLKIFETLKVSK